MGGQMKKLPRRDQVGSSLIHRAASPGHYRVRIALFAGIFIVLLITGFLMTGAERTARAQGGELSSELERGLVFTGLERTNLHECRGGFQVQVPNANRVICTHGPDPAPPGESIFESAAPLPRSHKPAELVCEGDGQSGNRVQVVYARASDRPDRYAEYADTFRQWAAAVDGMISATARQTGGDRHVRFVHDANCQVLVENVVLPADGDDNLSNTVISLYMMGYSRSDRDYLVFMDANVYCGIGTITSDDSPGAGNVHNTGPYYSRVDAGCWNEYNAAHELTHNLGGVQLSAPHATGRWHCTDESDRMCYQDSAGVVMQYVCDSSNEVRLDCNHDDYFNTNPAPGSYLATHWNVADNAFLSRSTSPTAILDLFVDSLQTGRIDKSGQFAPADSFRRGKAIQVRAHVFDQYGANIPGVEIRIRVNKPDGTKACSLRRLTGSGGFARRPCAIPVNAPTGQWEVKVTRLYKDGFVTGRWSISTHSFMVTE